MTRFLRRLSKATVVAAVSIAGTVFPQTININTVDCTSGSVTFTGGKINVVASGPCTSTVVAPPPTISTFSPVSAQVGQNVTITGANFAANATVSFPTTQATLVGTPTSNTLMFTVPNVTSGPKTLVVTVGTQTVSATFTVDPTPAPTITGFSLPSASVGTTVMATGTNFAAGATVTVNGTPATVTAGTTALSLSFVVPNTSPSPLNYPASVPVVISVGGQSVSSQLTLIAPATPTITSFMPTTPNPGAPVGASVTITGIGLVSGATVSVGGQNATISGTPTGLSLTFVIPAVMTGVRDVQVSVGGVLSAAVYTYTVTAPTISSPTITSCGGSVNGSAVITGTNFVAGSTTVAINGTSAVVTNTTATSLTVTLPAGIVQGGAPVVVTVAGAPATATGTCTIAVAGSITVDKDGNPIPIPSKFGNITPGVHSGANGANGTPGYPARQNAWAVLPTGLCPTTAPAITRIWYHNLDMTSYLNGNAPIEPFGFYANETLIYSFIAPAEGTRLGFQFAEDPTRGVAPPMFMTLSTTPCDYDYSKANGLSGCYVSRTGGVSLGFLSTTGAGVFFECKIAPGTRYYLNIRSQDAGAPTLDTCLSATQSTAAFCGGLLAIK